MVPLSYLAFAVLASVTVALFASWTVKRKEPGSMAMVGLVIIVSAIIAYLVFPSPSGLGILWPFLLVGTAAAASMLPILYRNKALWFMIILFIIVYAVAISYDRAATIGMFGVGTVIGMLYNEHFRLRLRENKSMRRTTIELKRDMIQILMGIVVLCIMIFSYSYLQSGDYLYILFWIMALGYLFTSFISNRGKVFNKLSNFERKGTEFGSGAIHLLAGFAILLGFASFKLALFGVFPLFFGDALATITGITLYRSNKLPHNRRKSVAGTLAFLVASAVPGFIILGVWGVVLALVLTAVESIDFIIDDNVTVPIVSVLLGALLGF